MTVKPETITAALGLNNKQESHRVKPNYLVDGFNIDIDDTGRVRRRLGYTQIAAGNMHSLWSDGEKAYFVEGTTLKELLPDLSSRTLLAGLGIERTVSYCRVNNVVYWSNGELTGRIVDGQARTWGMEAPPLPNVTVSNSGVLLEGSYLYTAVWMRSDGFESPARRARAVSVARNQALVFDWPGLVFPQDAVALLLYVSTANGAVMYREGIVNPGATSVTMTTQTGIGVRLRTHLLSPPPPGNLVAVHAGRIYVAGDVLYYSNPFEYEHFDLRNYVPISGITLLAPVDDGIFVGTNEETVFLSGRDPAQFNKVFLSDEGVVPGTASLIPASKLLSGETVGPAWVWFSKGGVCVGTNGGQYRNLTEKDFAFPAGTRGAGVIKERNNIPQYTFVIRK